jgi:SlyX protein
MNEAPPQPTLQPTLQPALQPTPEPTLEPTEQPHELAHLLSRIDQRLTELEVKAAFNEDVVDRLNAVIIRQQDQIDLLIREVRRLKEQQDPAPQSLRDALPPHY